ncbi:hypothetical protein HK096_001852 [Nowakowskiella sp. JEL0078]|nr:hypothetical protein HK096_001852 [Nowakowskiella sp. JEL0078]
MPYFLLQVNFTFAKKYTALVNTDHFCDLPDYSKIHLNMLPRSNIVSLSSLLGNFVNIEARLHTSRLKGQRLFLVLRQNNYTIQAIAAVDDLFSKDSLKWASSITPESIILIKALVVKAPSAVQSCSVQDVELKIFELYRLSSAERLPFSVEDTSSIKIQPHYDKSEVTKVNLETRLNNRIIDLRGASNQSIFRIQAAITKYFREFLDERDFVEIHTPKIIGSATEGGASVFKLPYFKKTGYLAQSPQFYKQMCICADFGRVYEVAPVFRAENSVTHRHMTEFIGLDIEMTLVKHYDEVLHFKELEVIKKEHSFTEFQFLENTPRLTFMEAVVMLRDAGHHIANGEDLSTNLEKALGDLVKHKYKTDFFILDKFPIAVRPFYTMPNSENKMLIGKNLANAFDFFMRGEEILSGAQRVHNVDLLTVRAQQCGVDVGNIKSYLDSFRYGTPRHGGAGIGLERVVMLYLDLGNVRKATLFPRDPKRLDP